MTRPFDTYFDNVTARLRAIAADADAGLLDPAIELIATGLAGGGVLQAFGTGHSQAFAMEVAGRAGGFIPSHALGLFDLVVLGGYPASMIGKPEFERSPTVADDLWRLYEFHPADVFLIASNSGANASTVGLALRAKAEGHPVIAVTSLEHSRGVKSRHGSGQRLFEVADLAIDNRAPYGDSTILRGDEPAMGPVSSITSAFIAQLLTLGTAERLREMGIAPDVFISANIPGGDEHNIHRQEALGCRINPYVFPVDGGAADPGPARLDKAAAAH